MRDALPKPRAIAVAAFIGLFAASATAQTAHVPDDLGPEFLEVRIDGQLNLRIAPAEDGGRVGRLDDGTVLRNLGCGAFDAGRWCQIETLDGSSAGWASADYLIESAYEDAEAMQPDRLRAASTKRVNLSSAGAPVQIRDTAPPEAPLDFLVRAEAGTFLDFSLVEAGAQVLVSVFEPDGELVYSSENDLRDFFGELRKPGDHVVRVLNRGSEVSTFELELAVE